MHTNSLLAEDRTRKLKLDEGERSHRYFYDADQATSWMDEQELYMMSSDKAKVSACVLYVHS